MEIRNPGLRERIGGIVRRLLGRVGHGRPRAREGALRDPAGLGAHGASDLLRLSRWLLTWRDDEAVIDLRGRTASMMEWNPEHASEELADMQREACHWRRLWPLDSTRPLLAFREQRMSELILELSGLLEQAR